MVFMKRLPLTPNGKIDGNALPPPATERPELDTAYAAPRTDLEHTFATAWSRVLHIDRVGIDDRFMDLGGDSLRLVKLHTDLTRTIRQPLPITDLFRFPTIRSLAAHLEKPSAAGRTSRILARAERQNAALGGTQAGALRS
jgi:acyl carrier protein